MTALRAFLILLSCLRVLAATLAHDFTGVSLDVNGVEMKGGMGSHREKKMTIKTSVHYGRGQGVKSGAETRRTFKDLCFVIDEEPPVCIDFESAIVEGSEGGNVAKTEAHVNFEKLPNRRAPPKYLIALLLGRDDGRLISSSNVIRIGRENGGLKKLTMVLTLTESDIGRSNVLLRTLDKFATRSQGNLVTKLLVVVPDKQKETLKESLPPVLHESDLPVEVFPEQALFQEFNPQWDKYALQMGIKLMVSRVVEDDWYVTLDADVVVTGDLEWSDFVSEDGRGNYVQEKRSQHPAWWAGSGMLTGFNVDVGDKGLMDDPSRGIGVTPAVMSVAGASFVIGRIKAVSDADTNFEESWIGGFGESWWWSEVSCCA